MLRVDPSLVESLRERLAVELRAPGAAPLRTRIEELARHGAGTLRLRFEGIRDRTRAESLAGAEAWVARDDLGDLGEDELLDVDLLGCTAVTRDGLELGRIVEIVATGANDVFVVDDGAGGEVLVPAVAHAVLEIDCPGRRIVVEADALEYSRRPDRGADQPKRRRARSAETGRSAETE